MKELLIPGNLVELVNGEIYMPLNNEYMLCLGEYGFMRTKDYNEDGSLSIKLGYENRASWTIKTIYKADNLPLQVFSPTLLKKCTILWQANVVTKKDIAEKFGIPLESLIIV